jgi:hypothetical protein
MGDPAGELSNVRRDDNRPARMGDYDLRACSKEVF